MRKNLSQVFLYIIYTVLTIFTCVMVASVHSYLKSEMFIYNFNNQETIHASVSFTKDKVDLTKLTDKSNGSYLISKPLDNNEEIIGIYFNKTPFLNLDIASGRYFSEKDFTDTKKKIVIGSNLKKNTKKINGKSYFLFDDSQYEVIGILKDKNRLSWTKNKAYINLNSIENLKKYLHNENIQFNAKKNTRYVFNSLKSQTIGSINFNEVQKETVHSPFTNLLNDKAISLLIYGLVLVTFIGNTFSASSYWLDSLNKEIGIRKCVGASNLAIAVFIYKKMCSILLRAVFLGILFSFMINVLYLKEGFIDIFSIVITVGIIFLTNVITVIFPIIKAFKIQPILMVR